MGVGFRRHVSAALRPGERDGTRCIGGWVGPRAGAENLAPLGNDSRTVQPVASRCTD